MRVLTVEDEERLAQNLATAISRNAGFAVDVALDGNEGLQLATSGVFDAIILDLMLPGISGQNLLEEPRKAGHNSSVLVLTAPDDKNSIVGLLDSGADDYLAKPFDLGERSDRAKALIRLSRSARSLLATRIRVAPGPLTLRG